MSALHAHVPEAASSADEAGSQDRYQAAKNNNMPEVRETISDDVEKGNLLTPEQQRLSDFFKDTAAKSIDVADDLLGKIATYCLAIIAGIFAALKADAISNAPAIVSIIFYIASLAIAIRGLYPNVNYVHQEYEDSLRAFEVDVISRKRDTLFFAVAAFAIGLLVAVGGLIWHSVSPAFSLPK